MNLFNKKDAQQKIHRFLGGSFGAGSGSRTRVSTLEGSHNSRYTIPALSLLNGLKYIRLFPSCLERGAKSSYHGLKPPIFGSSRSIKLIIGVSCVNFISTRT